MFFIVARKGISSTCILIVCALIKKPPFCPLLDIGQQTGYNRFMSSILDLPEVRERVSRVSVAEYHRMGEFNEDRRRTELIQGIVIEKLSKTALHRRLAMRLYQIIAACAPADFFVMKEEPLTLHDSEPEPDVSVIAGNEDDFFSKHPETAALVVEVAVSSPALDRANAPLYAEAGVLEYWIVLGREQRIEVYRQPVSGQYEQKLIVSRGQSLECASVPGVTVDLDALFAKPPGVE